MAVESLDDILESNQKIDLVCPQCGKDFIQRASRNGVIERLLSAAYIYPFRCQVCTHRFRAQQWGVRYETRWINMREYHRLTARIPVSFSSDHANGVGTVTNISMGGCGMETVAPLEVGAILRLQLTIAASDPPVSVEAGAVRCARAKFVGVQFLRIKPEEHDRFTQYIHGLLGAAERSAR